MSKTDIKTSKWSTTKKTDSIINKTRISTDAKKENMWA